MMTASSVTSRTKGSKTPGLLQSWDSIEEFIFAGNATFTLVSLKTGVRFTYIVRVKKGDLDLLDLNKAHSESDMVPPSKRMSESEVVYFVNLLRGPNNEQDFAYMGVVRQKPARFFWTAASGKVGRGAPAHKAIVWMLDALQCRRDVLGKTLEVWHEGRCGRCGRKLTVPESIAAGLGPECAGRMEAA
jgi:hypothetical protein